VIPAPSRANASPSGPPDQSSDAQPGDPVATHRNAAPRVSIGVPVYNGEAYLEEALLSIAAQTWSDYEVILSDNASTDRTREICLAYAARDSRVRYVRNDVNIGGDRNHNRCFELSRGVYFLGLAHDDRLEPTYVERAVAVLEAEPSIVFCHSRTRIIDASGAPTDLQEPHAFSDSDRPDVRLRDAICDAQSVVVGFGMMRSSVLRQTPLFKPYPSSDAFLQADLSLRGRLYEIPEILFNRRLHAKTGHAIPMYERLAWSNPSGKASLYFPAWRRVGEYFAAVARAPLRGGERLRCVAVVLAYCRERRILPQLTRDLRMAARQAALQTALGRRLQRNRKSS
jgi:glycosyltransferase involved in cell wall biosynthesis